MRILIVASFNKGYFAPFILEQARALEKLGCDVRFFGIKRKGLIGYLKSLPDLKQAITEHKPDIIHAHYGLCGLLANLQRRIPVVTTYHGSDINDRKVLPFSKVAMILSKHNIFVSKRNIKIARPHFHYSYIPCGIDLSDIQLTDKEEARQKLGMDLYGKYVLFAGALSNKVKNAGLAQESIALLKDVELLELIGYDREQVMLLMCAADAFLMTSHTEGSPQVVKEALACGCPIVSVDVGDVKYLIDGVSNCHIVKREPESIAEKLTLAMECNQRTNGRARIVELNLINDVVARKLIDIYRTIV